MSKITTHILDTAKGCPAEGVIVTLYRVTGSPGRGMERVEEKDGKPGPHWNEIEMARGGTNKDGRIVDWLGPETDAAGNVNADRDAIADRDGIASGKANANRDGDRDAPGNGIYKIRFEIKEYFDKQSVPSFYPFVDIYFEMTVDGHYHIPLLISPFGYSTYRGS